MGLMLMLVRGRTRRKSGGISFLLIVVIQEVDYDCYKDLGVAQTQQKQSTELLSRESSSPC